MASGREMSISKRPHVKTERMQEFMKTQDVGSPTKKLKCPEPMCNKEFTSSPGLKYHRQTHNISHPQFQCRRCLKEFKSANGLKYHRERTKCDDTNFEYSGSFVHRHVPKQLDLTALCLPSVKNSLNQSECQNITTSPGIEFSSSSLHSTGMDKLTELAIIATSPQSPLMRKPKPPWDKTPSAEIVRSLVKMLDEGEKDYYGDTSECFGDREQLGVQASQSHVSTDGPTASLPDVKPVQTAKSGHVESSSSEGPDGSDPRVSTSSPLSVSPDETDTMTTSTWSHSWPTALWQCFIAGTQVRFLDSHDSCWQLVDTLAQKEDLAQKAASNYVPSRYAPDGLMVKTLNDVIIDTDQSELEITFTSSANGQPDLLANCQRDHPFFVKDKGWSSCDPCETVVHYGIPCSELCVGDVCLPPTHSDAAFTEEIFKSCDKFEFTPEDTSAVFALSSMKQHKKESDQSPPPGSKKPVGRRPAGKAALNKPKRPMNAFLLFAKEFRLGYMQKFPKRDNRAISVILGEHWKSLSVSQRGVYEERARYLADKQKKKHPDCWKRKKEIPRS
ncbi:HMG box-containing protein 1-like isoform X2 [Mya arenaria]|uniref:HMG box-containing protein 1-like isoform X2 n=1 Tax=Mya arenaria TaxID=6604 RepID=UPI0022E1379A|nr:HMG box-containing protein 1-like isoform X2 [Mya arenaria]